MPHVDEDIRGSARFIFVLLLFQPALPCYRPQLHGKGLQFVDADVAEGFAGDSGIAAETIHAVPAGGVDAELLHEL